MAGRVALPSAIGLIEQVDLAVEDDRVTGAYSGLEQRELDDGLPVHQVRAGGNRLPRRSSLRLRRDREIHEVAAIEVDDAGLSSTACRVTYRPRASCAAGLIIDPARMPTVPVAIGDLVVVPDELRIGRASRSANLWAMEGTLRAPESRCYTLMVSVFDVTAAASP